MLTNYFTFVFCKAQKMKFQYKIVTRYVERICENLPKQFIPYKLNSFWTISTGFLAHCSVQNCALNHVQYFVFRLIVLFIIRIMSKLFSFVL